MSVIAALLAVARRRRWLVLATVAVLTAAAALLASRTSFGTNVLTLLPGHSPSLEAFRRYVDRFGAEEQLYIVFEPADRRANVADAAAEIDTYVARLRALPEIAKVDAGIFDAGKDWTYVQERTFALIGPQATRAALVRFSEKGMREALEASRELLATPSPDIRRLVQMDPLGLLALVRDHFAPAVAGADPEGRGGYTSADGRSRLVMATPAGPPFDSEFCRRLFARLGEIEAEAPALRIAYAGGHRIAFETESIIRREATLNTVTSVAAILVLLLAVFRSPWLFFVGAIPMSVATIGSIAINGLVRDQLSAAATGTSALLFGLGIDGLVLLYARYLEEIESGRSADAAIARLGGAGVSMFLGCVTTAATFFGLTMIDLPGLQELGRLVGVGMLLGAPLTLLLVAALLPSRIARPRPLSAPWLAAFVRRRQWSILIGAAVATIIAVPMVASLALDLRLQRLQPQTPAIALQQDLQQRFGLERDVAIAIAHGPDLAGLLAIDRTFQTTMRGAAPALRVSGPAHFVPPISEQDETARILAASALDVDAVRSRLLAAADAAGFRPGAIDPFLARLPRLLDPSQRLTYQGYVDHGLGDVIARYLVAGPDGYTTAAYVEVADQRDVAAASSAAASAGPGLVLTGVPVVNADLTARFAPEFGIALAIGCGAVFLLILFTFRRVGPTIVALLPAVLGLIWAAALLAWLDVRLDLFSIFAVLMLIGISVDYGIHLVHRVISEPGSFDLALARIAPANFVAAAIAVLGCGSLVMSTYPPLRSLGIVMVVGLTTCLVSAVLVLPALLMVTTRPRETAQES
jgi:predicted RND superfamily exporter protein